MRNASVLHQSSRLSGGRRLVVCSAASTHTRVVFSLPRKLKEGQKLKLVGSVDPLGAWDITKAVELEPVLPQCHFVEVAVPAGEKIEYKFFTQTEEDYEWQPTENFLFDIPPGTEGADVTITDDWEGKRRAVTWNGLVGPQRSVSAGSDSSSDKSEYYGAPSQSSSATPSHTEKATAAQNSSLQSSKLHDSSEMRADEPSSASPAETEVRGSNGSSAVEGNSASTSETQPPPPETPAVEHRSARNNIVPGVLDRESDKQDSAKRGSGSGSSSRRGSDPVPWSGKGEAQAGGGTAQATRVKSRTQAGRRAANPEDPSLPKSVRMGDNKNEHKLENMTVKALKSVLKGLGLPVKRRKAEMIDEIRKNKE